MKQVGFTNRKLASTLGQISGIPAHCREELRAYYGNWKLNLKTNLLFLSPTAKNLLGLIQENDYALRQLVRLIDLKSFEKAKNWIRMMGAGGVLEPIMLKTYTTDGTAIWIKLSGFYYTDHHESPGLILGIIQDCTQNVDEERISLSILNHEIRTPLSVMKLCAQFIQRAGKDPSKVSIPDLAGKIERQIEGVTKLLDHYLSDASDYSKFPALNLSVFDLNQVVLQVVNDLVMIHCQHKFINKNSGQTMVMADKHLIMQVLVNYLTNAVKYSPTNTAIKVEVYVDEGIIMVGVADQGQGVPSGLEKRVFEKFFRCNEPCERDVAGRGLGLYLVKQIIERHKGSVWMKNDGKKGSVFFFSLPLHRPECETRW